MQKIITLEGLDGSGKTTIATHLKEILSNQLKTVEIIREPGGTEIAEEIRRMVLKPGIDKMAQLLLFNAARCENISKLVKDKYKDIDIIIFDRFFYSTLVYQGVLNNIPFETIYSLNELLFKDIVVYKHFYIHASFETLENRLKTRNMDINYFDTIDRSIKLKMIDKYTQLAQQGELILIDGEQTIEKITKNIENNI